MAASKQPVGILGGSFDPVHNGHLSIAKSFLNSGYIGSLLVLLSPEPPHKKSHKFAHYHQRLRMLRAAFRPLKNVEISELEATLPRPSYTVQTLRHLRNTRPDTSFFLCLGKDSFLDFKTWYKWREILNFCQLLIADRPDSAGEYVQNDLSNKIHFVKHKPIKISSSEVREKIQQNKPVVNLVPDDVLKIISDENLYKN